MANYSGEINVNGSAQGQCVFYAPSDANNFNVYYVSGANPITVSGINGSPEPSSQDSGTNVTYQVSNPVTGVVVNYTGQLTLQWNWVP